MDKKRKAAPLPTVFLVIQATVIHWAIRGLLQYFVCKFKTHLDTSNLKILDTMAIKKLYPCGACTKAFKVIDWIAIRTITVRLTESHNHLCLCSYGNFATVTQSVQ
jgi:hypothetical protein